MKTFKIIAVAILIGVVAKSQAIDPGLTAQQKTTASNILASLKDNAEGKKYVKDLIAIVFPVLSGAQKTFVLNIIRDAKGNLDILADIWNILERRFFSELREYQKSYVLNIIRDVKGNSDALNRIQNILTDSFSSLSEDQKSYVLYIIRNAKGNPNALSKADKIIQDSVALTFPEYQETTDLNSMTSAK